MKKLLLLFPLFLFGCTHSESKQQQAQDAVKTYIQTTLSNPATYKGIAFKDFHALKSIVINDLNYQQIFGKYNRALNDFLEEKADLTTGDPNAAGENQLRGDSLKADSFKKQMTDFQKAYRPKTVGWSITHSFKIKDESGALTIKRMVFELDSTLTTVTRAETVR